MVDGSAVKENRIKTNSVFQSKITLRPLLEHLDQLHIQFLQRICINKVGEAITGAFGKRAHSIDTPDLKEPLQQ